LKINVELYGIHPSLGHNHYYSLKTATPDYRLYNLNLNLNLHKAG
jgi:hypothetical protein